MGLKRPRLREEFHLQEQALGRYFSLGLCQSLQRDQRKSFRLLLFLPANGSSRALRSIVASQMRRSLCLSLCYPSSARAIAAAPYTQSDRLWLAQHLRSIPPESIAAEWR